MRKKKVVFHNVRPSVSINPNKSRLKTLSLCFATALFAFALTSFYKVEKGAGTNNSKLLQSEVFKIHLHRRFEIGDEFALSKVLTIFKTEARKTPGQLTIPKLTQYRIELAAKTKIVAIDNLGTPTITHFIIESLNFYPNLDDSLGSKSILPVGEELTLVCGNPPQINFRSGLKPKNEIMNIIKEVITRCMSSPITDDDVFGNSYPQKIGNSWPVNSKMVAQECRNDGMIVKPRDISGKVRLASLQTVNGFDCYEIEVKSKINNVQLVTLPDDITLLQLKVRLEKNISYPIDTTKPSLKINGKDYIKYAMKINADSTIVEIETIEIEDFSITPI